MAKDKSLSKEERKAAKKAAKEKEAEVLAKVESNGISKPSKSDKKEKKKDKKSKKEALSAVDAVTTSSTGKDGEVVSDDEMEMDTNAKTGTARPIGALVPFANPLADEKVGKKVFKSVKKAAAQRTLKRGVKEVVKALRKSTTSTTDKPSPDSLPIGVVILAADISPMDVISHIPVLCEDHDIPYVYVTSRAELGIAGQTKRPTSVVMVSKDLVKKAGKTADDANTSGGKEEEWLETYKGLVKTVEREGRHVKI